MVEVVSVDRLQLLRNARRIVVKVGTAVLTSSEGKLDAGVFQEIARQCEHLVATSRSVILVSSGAIALGVAQLGLTARPRRMDALQACAAVGQGHLIRQWSEAFAPYGRTVAQVLLTHADLADRKRFLNARRCLFELSERGVIPIVNENDTVSVEEIAFGDNDALSDQVANLVNADLLVMLSVAPGLLDGKRCIPEVADADQKLQRFIWKQKSRGGTGGMVTKINAARSAAARGTVAIIAPGKTPKALDLALSGAEIGTVFLPSPRGLGSRAHWIAHTLRAKGTIIVDAGAVQALIERKRSLLPTGVVALKGNFSQGDAVDLAGPDGTVFARGLSAYSSAEVESIRGKRAKDIHGILGYHLGDEVVHRNDLVMLKPIPSLSGRGSG